ncbi:MAG: ABC transporter permease subunit [Pseudomonadota bacterium]
MDWLDLFLDERMVFPIWFTARVAAVTLVLHLAFGVPLAYYLSKPSSWLRNSLEVLITIPLVFPPVALGFVLLLLLGRHGPVGRGLSRFLGVEIIFSPVGVVIAAFIAGLPLIVKPVQAAIQNTAGRLIEAAWMLGKSEWQTMFFVVLPAVRRSIAGGLTLAFARSLGEVGLTLMLGGNIVGKTNTLSLEIYNAVFTGEFERAKALAVILGLTSLGLFTLIKKYGASKA